jgi:TIR domain
MAQGAWIFLSHSHRDFEKVRTLRNEIELRGHQPLAFFLKCLGDDSEIDNLIEREIAARSWFIFCDSENSRTSRWVQREREIISSLPEHSAVTVSLEAHLSKQLESLAPLLMRASIFPSYSRNDEPRVAPILQALRSADFGVFSDLDISGNVVDELNSAIQAAVTKGAVLVFVSRSSMSSQWQRYEIAAALRYADPAGHRTNVIPIFLDHPTSVLDLAPEVERQLFEIRGFDFSGDDFNRNRDQLFQWLRNFPWRR